MKGIILAAGRGSRMSGLTEERPKCLVEIAGQPLLYWQLTALRDAGVDDIAVVCGYRSEMIEAQLDRAPAHFTILRNPRWAETNMLSTLFCAAEWANEKETIVSYSDIVYPAAHVAALTGAKQPIAITYDTQWEALWRLRQENPLEDAETFLAQDGLLKEIGNKPQSLEQVQGQYMGLIKITPEGWRIMSREKDELADLVNKTDMTGFLRRLLTKNIPVGAVPVAGKWCEVDSERDLELYTQRLTAENWTHDWRNREAEKTEKETR